MQKGSHHLALARCWPKSATSALEVLRWLQRLHGRPLLKAASVLQLEFCEAAAVMQHAWGASCWLKLQLEVLQE